MVSQYLLSRFRGWISVRNNPSLIKRPLISQEQQHGRTVYRLKKLTKIVAHDCLWCPVGHQPGELCNMEIVSQPSLENIYISEDVLEVVLMEEWEVPCFS